MSRYCDNQVFLNKFIKWLNSKLIDVKSRYYIAEEYSDTIYNNEFKIQCYLTVKDKNKYINKVWTTWQQKHGKVQPELVNFKTDGKTVEQAAENLLNKIIGSSITFLKKTVDIPDSKSKLKLLFDIEGI